jgi:hypothetical protein
MVRAPSPQIDQDGTCPVYVPLYLDLAMYVPLHHGYLLWLSIVAMYCAADWMHPWLSSHGVNSSVSPAESVSASIPHSWHGQGRHYHPPHAGRGEVRRRRPTSQSMAT